jgi:predicted DNA binding CopG/RHH family protein
MTSKLLSVNLGDLYPLLKVMSESRQQTASESLRALICEIITQKNPSIHIIKPERVRFAASDLHDPFKALCKQHGMSPSIMLKALVLEELVRLLQREEDTQLRPPSHSASTFEAHAHVGVTDHKRHRVGLRVSDSELTQLQNLAQQRGTSVQRLIVQLIRALLLNINAFAPQEINELGAINLSLMRIGSNLNQIAKRFNANKDAPADVDTLDDIAACVKKINTHVQDCSKSLQLSRERWRIELRT